MNSKLKKEEISIASTKLFKLLGIFRRFLIWPSSMIWPDNLPYIAFLRTLHDSAVDGPPVSKNIRCCPLSRLQFLVVVSIGQFVYQWLPDFITPALKAFSWMCMIHPQNRLLAQLTSANTFSMFGSMQLDWLSLIGYLYSPFIVPRWAQVNMFIGFILIAWLCGPLIFYMNLWDVNKLSIRDSVPHTSDGNPLDLFSLISNLNNTEGAFEQYEISSTTELRFSTVTILYYATSFAILPALVTHTLLYHGRSILQQCQTSLSNRTNDIHCKLMNAYPETPEYWFTILFIISFLCFTLVCHFGQLLSWYLTILAIVLAFVFILPCGIATALTTQNMNDLLIVNVVLGGLLRHGDPIGFGTFTLIITITQIQTLYFLQLLKLSHYMKIPPRAIFITVIPSAIISSIVTYVTSDYVLENIKGICTAANSDWMCSATATIFVESVFWSSVGKYFLS